MKKGVVIGSLLLLICWLLGCVQQSNKDESRVLYYVPIIDTGAYWSSIRQGAEDKAKELGYELIIKTTSANDAQKNEKHLGFLDEAIGKKVAGVALAAIDPDMFDRKVSEVSKAGIPVVTFDADVQTTTNRITYVGTDNYEAGVILGRESAQYLKDRGIVAGSLGTAVTLLTQTTMVMRLEGLKAGFAEVMGEHANNFIWLEPIADEHQAAQSKRKVEAQIAATPNLVALFSLGSAGPDIGVTEALRASGKFHHAIPHFGFDYTPTWDNALNDGLVAAIVDQDPYMMGQELIVALDRVNKGEGLPSYSYIPVHWILAEDLASYGESKKSQ